jgi:hypothetical protein
VNHVHRILSTQLAGHPGEKVRLAGWVHRRRLLKSVAFLILRDRAGLAQVVVRQGDLATLPEETVVEVTGTVAVNPAAPGGAELVEPTITGLSGPAEPPPFDLYRPELSASLPVQLDHAPLALRHLTRRSTLRLSAAVVAGFRRALDELGFTEIHTPKIVGSATESGANVFAIDYFGRPAYLAQSPQFYKQMMVGVVERVYEVGPVFRAEPHDTGRHLAQYTSLDAELGFITDHRDVMAVVRHAVAGMAPSTVDVPEEIPAVHFADALSLLGVSPEEPRPRPGTRAPARRVGVPGVRQRLPVRHRIPDGEAAVLHVPATGPSGVLELLRPVVPGHGDLDRRATAAPVPRLRRGAGGPGRARRRGIPGDVPVRHASARRLRDRAGALRGAGPGRGQRTPDDALPARPAPVVAVVSIRG